MYRNTIIVVVLHKKEIKNKTQNMQKFERGFA